MSINVLNNKIEAISSNFYSIISITNIQSFHKLHLETIINLNLYIFTNYYYVALYVQTCKERLTLRTLNLIYLKMSIQQQQGQRA